MLKTLLPANFSFEEVILAEKISTPSAKQSTKQGFKEACKEVAEYISKNGVRIVHLFNKANPKGGLTIAYEPVCKGTSNKSTGDFAKVSIAYCNPKDTYNRKVGTVLAVNNMYTTSYVLLPIYRNGTPTKTLIRIFESMQ